MNGILDWEVFAYKFRKNPQAAFETLAYHMFCQKFHITEGLPASYNQKHIETNPHCCEDGTIVGFQAKYYSTPSISAAQKKELIETIESAARTYSGLNLLYFYISRPFSQNPSPGETKTKMQTEIEEKADSLGIKVEWVVPSNFEIILTDQAYSDLKKYFFEEDKLTHIVDFKSHYRNKHSIATENSEICYVRDEKLFKIINDFIKYRWEEKAEKVFLKGEISEKIIGDSVKNDIGRILFDKQPLKALKNRYLDCDNLIHDINDFGNDKREIKEVLQKIKTITFGNCLFISGQYGIGKTRLLRHIEVNKGIIVDKEIKERYVCYLDLLDTEGAFDEKVVCNLIRNYFGDSYNNIKSFLDDYVENYD